MERAQPERERAYVCIPYSTGMRILCVARARVHGVYVFTGVRVALRWTMGAISPGNILEIVTFRGQM